MAPDAAGPAAVMEPARHLEPAPRCNQGEQRPRLILKRIEPLEARAPQIGRLETKSLGDETASFRRSEDEHAIDEAPIRRGRMTYSTYFRIISAREIGTA